MLMCLTVPQNKGQHGEKKKKTWQAAIQYFNNSCNCHCVKGKHLCLNFLVNLLHHSCNADYNWGEDNFKAVAWLELYLGWNLPKWMRTAKTSCSINSQHRFNLVPAVKSAESWVIRQWRRSLGATEAMTQLNAGHWRQDASPDLPLTLHWSFIDW